MSTLKVNDIIEATSGGGKIWPSRAWVRWNQTGTLSILSDGGVSSMTDSGVGMGKINFDNTRSNSNYAFVGAVNTYYSTTRWDCHCTEYNYGSLVRSTSQVPYNIGYGGYAELDFSRNSAVITE